MRLLPKWALLDPPSAIYDLESVTPLQQTARVYSKMQEMIREYNQFAEQINKEIVDFIGSSETEISNFQKYVEKRISCKFEDMDATIAKMKVDVSNQAEEKFIQIYKEYLDDYVNLVINEKIASGDIYITLVYDPETESLNMTTEEV